jgi:hypothetical protein
MATIMIIGTKCKCYSSLIAFDPYLGKKNSCNLLWYHNINLVRSKVKVALWCCVPALYISTLSGDNPNTALKVVNGFNSLKIKGDEKCLPYLIKF